MILLFSLLLSLYISYLLLSNIYLIYLETREQVTINNKNSKIIFKDYNNIEIDSSYSKQDINKVFFFNEDSEEYSILKNFYDFENKMNAKLLTEIKMDNLRLANDKKLFNNYFLVFFKNLIEIVNLKLEQQVNSNTICSTSCSSNNNGIKLLISKVSALIMDLFFDVAMRTHYNSNISLVVNEIIKFIELENRYNNSFINTSSNSFSSIVLNMFIYNKKLLSELLISSNETNNSHTQKIITVCVLSELNDNNNKTELEDYNNTLTRNIKENYIRNKNITNNTNTTNATTKPNSNNSTTPTVIAFLDILLTYIPVELSKNWTKMSSYLDIWSQLSESSSNVIINYMFEKDLIMRMIDFFLNKESIFGNIKDGRYEIGNKHCTPQFYSLISVVSNLVRRTIPVCYYSKTKILGNNLINSFVNRDEFLCYLESIEYDYSKLELPHTTWNNDIKNNNNSTNNSNKQNSNINNNSNDNIIVNTPLYLLTDKEIEALDYKPYYLKAHEFSSPVLSKQLAHLMYNSFDFSKKKLYLLMELFNDTINSNKLKLTFDCLKEVMLLKDRFTLVRIEWVFGIPQIQFRYKYDGMPKLHDITIFSPEKQIKFISHLLYSTSNDALNEKIVYRYQSSSDYIKIINYYLEIVLSDNNLFEYIYYSPYSIIKKSVLEYMRKKLDEKDNKDTNIIANTNIIINNGRDNIYSESNPSYTDAAFVECIKTIKLKDQIFLLGEEEIHRLENFVDIKNGYEIEISKFMGLREQFDKMEKDIILGKKDKESNNSNIYSKLFFSYINYDNIVAEKLCILDKNLKGFKDIDLYCVDYYYDTENNDYFGNLSNKDKANDKAYFSPLKLVRDTKKNKLDDVFNKKESNNIEEDDAQKIKDNLNKNDINENTDKNKDANNNDNENQLNLANIKDNNENNNNTNNINNSSSPANRSNNEKNYAPIRQNSGNNSSSRVNKFENTLQTNFESLDKLTNLRSKSNKKKNLVNMGISQSNLDVYYEGDSENSILAFIDGENKNDAKNNNNNTDSNYIKIRDFDYHHGYNKADIKEALKKENLIGNDVYYREFNKNNRNDNTAGNKKNLIRNYYILNQSNQSARYKVSFKIKSNSDSNSKTNEFNGYYPHSQIVVDSDPSELVLVHSFISNSNKDLGEINIEITTSTNNNNPNINYNTDMNNGNNQMDNNQVDGNNNYDIPALPMAGPLNYNEQTVYNGNNGNTDQIIDNSTAEEGFLVGKLLNLKYKSFLLLYFFIRMPLLLLLKYC